MQYLTKISRLCYGMFEQPIELSLVEVELMSKMLLHYVNPNNNTH